MEAGPSQPRSPAPAEGSAAGGPGPSTMANATANKSRARKSHQQQKKKKKAQVPPTSTPAPAPAAAPTKKKRPRKKPKPPVVPSSSSPSSDIEFIGHQKLPTPPPPLPPNPVRVRRRRMPSHTPPPTSPRPIPPASSPRSPGKKSKTKKRRERERIDRLEQKEMNEINGTFDDLEFDVLGDSAGVVTPGAGGEAGGDRKGKRKAANEVPIGDAEVAGRGEANTSMSSSYTPLRRSVIAGLKFSPEPPSRPPTPPGATTDDPGASKHFEPPAIFSASLDAPPEAGPSNPSSVTAAAVETNGLLLPAHIVLDGMDDAPVADGEAGEGDDEGLFFLDEDTTKNVQRYFDPTLPSTDADPTFLNTADSSRVCRKCKRPGHRSEQCPHLVCDLCGAMDDHEKGQCKFRVKCFKCGERGHRREECNNRPMKGCTLCGSTRHIDFSCPSHWRIYSYLSAEERRDRLEEKEGLVDWAREAAGGPEWEAWCYNCGREGHFGDDCNQRRGSLVPLDNPSPFSELIAGRGPFSRTVDGMRRSGPPVNGGGRGGGGSHMRFEDNLPDLQPAFAGLGAGQKGKQKALAAQRQAERVAGLMEDDDDPVWVSGGGGGSLRDRIGSGRPVRNTPMRHPLPARPWDSERRERTPQGGGRGAMPFGHGHLMSTGPAGRRDATETHWNPHANGSGHSGAHMGKGISFGKISMPGDIASGETPTGRGNGSVRARGGGAATLVARALGGHSGTPSRGSSASPGSSRAGSPLINGEGAKRKRREGEGGDAWSNGTLGGNVAGWGREMDGAERAEGRFAKQHMRSPSGGAGSPSGGSGSGGGGGGGGMRIKGASAGQASAGARAKTKSPKRGKGSVATAQKYYGGY